MLRLVRRAGWVGVWANVVLAAVKLTAGVLANSQALMADGVESLTDIVSSMLLVVGVKYWEAPPDAAHPHGHKRLETLFSAGVGLAMVAVAGGLAWNALHSLRQDSPLAPNAWALAVAVLTIVSKELLYRWTLHQSRLAGSPAVAANAWHHRSDAISSLPVALAIGLAWISPQWAFVDKVGAVVVSFFILHAAWKILGPALNELMDKGAPAEEVQRILTLCCAAPEVRGAHHIRTRYLSAGVDVSLHLLVDPNITVLEGHTLAHEAKERIMAGMPHVLDVTIHVEPFGATTARPLLPGACDPVTSTPQVTP
ncbi:putative cobalt-zinc-cadmium resistance protein [Megalodesulfovibrio gigas DSM 1382 = ATCC 19364]|uniref:Putative cobalt-zinc-cadmium resistance protein n=1 Tax=Megalodesulfovibrio gigas (strain ATCC 19364 / DSM 1382 / NCIMB 9332 / VKM B-1759) TaxID=1121448 RepID=T2GBG6_MEGG1|nr:putative cobalt-zinc-cadmium resistance protein [Megalodesulfovibrio gigas DSM 1382 = ATCC 19364]